MAAYILSGLRVRADLQLPLVPIEAPEAVDVHIQVGRVLDGSEILFRSHSDDFVCSRFDGQVVLAWPGMKFAITWDRIVYDVDNMEHSVNFLLQPAWSVLLTARGHEALHGTAVAHSDKAIAILGESGSGKTTAALSLLDRGWTLIADDVLTIDRNVRVQLGPPFIRLTPDRAEGRKGYWDLQGKLRYAPALSQAPMALSAILVHVEGCDKLERAIGSAAVDLMLSNVFNIVWTHQGQAARRLQLAVCLAQSVPIFRVPPRSLTADILEHIAGSADLSSAVPIGFG